MAEYSPLRTNETQPKPFYYDETQLKNLPPKQFYDGALGNTRKPLGDTEVEELAPLTAEDKQYVSSNILRSPQPGRFVDNYGVKGVNFYMAPEYYKGYYEPSASNGHINLNANPLGKEVFSPSGVFEHEKQHLIDNEFGRMYTHGGRFQAPEPEREIKAKIYDKYARKYMLADDFEGRGFTAELRRIESQLPVGQGILDTDIGKESLTSPNLQSAYFARTAPTTPGQTQMMNPRALEETQPSKLRALAFGFRDMIRGRVSPDKYPYGR